MSESAAADISQSGQAQPAALVHSMMVAEPSMSPIAAALMSHSGHLQPIVRVHSAIGRAGVEPLELETSESTRETCKLYVHRNAYCA